MPRRRNPASPPLLQQLTEIIRRAVMLYVKYPHSLRNVARTCWPSAASM